MKASPLRGRLDVPINGRLTAWPKILLYSHDTYGLGNITRTLLLARDLMSQHRRGGVLIVTGSPIIHALRIPDGIDYIKLPCLDRVDAERYRPRYLSACTREVSLTRRQILKNAVLGFSPDLMIVDKRPAGIDGELLDTLQVLRDRHRATKLVLGIRDILNEPAQTIASLRESRFFETIDRYYDEVWIYGIRSVFDAVEEYRFPRSVAERTHYCGYLKRPSGDQPAPEGPPRVLVTTGGGGDGADLIGCYLEGLSALPRRLPLRSTIVFGPQMSDRRRDALTTEYGFLPDVEFVDFEPELTPRYAQAGVVVSMAGYNTVCELLSMRRRAVLVPRVNPVREQLLRARIFSRLGFFDVIEPHALSPERLLTKVLHAFAKPPIREIPVDMEGLPRIRRRIRALLGARVP